MANILIIGNGFDLAHNLKTNYSDYLKQLELNSPFYNYMSYNKDKNTMNKLKKFINGIVYRHLVSKMDENKGWIDFENEIKEIVDDLSNINNFFVKKLNIDTNEYYYVVEKKDLENIPMYLSRYIFKNNNLHLKWKHEDIQKITEETIYDIKLFIYFFEDYLSWISTNNEINPLFFFSKFSVDYLLSFNYTLTYDKLYNWGSKELEYKYCCNVHGEICCEHKIVMGIGSEFYDENIHEDFVELFKFYQRYKYETDCKYQEWFQNLENEKTFFFNEKGKYENHIITVFGHSLDPTDKDILFPFLSMKKAQIKIYYFGEKNKLKIEKNLLKILGRTLFEDYLIGKEKRIQLINCEGIV